MDSERKRGWWRLFPDPGNAAVALVAVVVGLAAGGGSTYVVKSNNAITTTQTQTETVTVAEESREAEGGELDSDFGPSSIGLEELNAEEEIQEEDSYEAEFGNRNIAGHEYGNAFTATEYADGTGLSDLTVNTKGRFSSMRFVVGIDAETSCPRSQARVWVADETGHVLWGPTTVGIATPARAESLPIPNPIQVNLVNRSAEGESSCDYGQVDVSWGGVQFRSD